MSLINYKSNMSSFVTPQKQKSIYKASDDTNTVL